MTFSTFEQDLVARLKRLVRNPANIVWAIVVPVLIVSIMGYILPNDDGIVRVYVQNKDGSIYSMMAVSYLQNEYSATVIDRDEDTRAAIDEIDKKYPDQTRIIIVIPVNFAQYVSKYKSGEEFQAQLTANGLSFVMDIMKTVNEADYNDGTAHLTVHSKTGSNIISRTFKTLNNNLILQVSPGLTVTLMLLITSGITTAVLREEREQRVDVILRNTRYNRGTQAVSMVVWALLPSTIALITTIITFSFFLDIHYDARIIVVCILSSSFAVAFAAIVTELVRNGQMVYIANTTLLFAMLLLCGGIFPKEMLSQSILDSSVYVPVSYLIDIAGCSMGFEGDFGHSVLISALFIAGMFFAWYALVKFHESRM